MIATWWLDSALIILGHFKFTFSHILHDTSHHTDACACSSVNAVCSVPFLVISYGTLYSGLQYTFFLHIFRYYQP